MLRKNETKFDALEKNLNRKKKSSQEIKPDCRQKNGRVHCDIKRSNEELLSLQHELKDSSPYWLNSAPKTDGLVLHKKNKNKQPFSPIYNHLVEIEPRRERKLDVPRAEQSNQKRKREKIGALPKQRVPRVQRGALVDRVGRGNQSKRGLVHKVETTQRADKAEARASIAVDFHVRENSHVQIGTRVHRKRIKEHKLQNTQSVKKNRTEKTQSHLQMHNSAQNDKRNCGVYGAQKGRQLRDEEQLPEVKPRI